MVVASASQRATIWQRPDPMASLRMFLPHQPEPISAVRSLRAEDCAEMNGAGSTMLAPAVRQRNCRRLIAPRKKSPNLRHFSVPVSWRVWAGGCGDLPLTVSGLFSYILKHLKHYSFDCYDCQPAGLLGRGAHIRADHIAARVAAPDKAIGQHRHG